MKKRLLSILLVLALVCALVPAVFAADTVTLRAGSVVLAADEDNGGTYLDIISEDDKYNFQFDLKDRVLVPGKTYTEQDMVENYTFVERSQGEQVEEIDFTSISLVYSSDFAVDATVKDEKGVTYQISYKLPTVTDAKGNPVTMGEDTWSLLTGKLFLNCDALTLSGSCPYPVYAFDTVKTVCFNGLTVETAQGVEIGNASSGIPILNAVTFLGDATVTLKGTNKITYSIKNGEVAAYALIGMESLKTEGTGDLTVDMSDAIAYQCSAVNVHKNYQNSSAVSATAGKGAGFSIGVDVLGDFTQTAGKLAAAAGTGTKVGACGLSVNGKTAIQGGTVTADAGTGECANGLNFVGEAVISGSASVTGFGGAGVSEFYGLWSPAALTVSGKAQLTLVGGTKDGQKQAALCLDGSSVRVSDNARLTANGAILASVADESTLKVTGGTKTKDGYTQSGSEPIVLECTGKPAGTGFSDVAADAWYAPGVKYCTEKGIMNGVSEGRFNPNGATTRAMIVTILWRLDGEKVANYAMRFTDVPSGSWYTEAVRWAAAEKIVSGYSDTKFGPNDSITREQLAAILWRYAKYRGCDVSAAADLSKFGDLSKVHDWALDAFKWASGANLINGSNGKLMPADKATRAQVASILQRFGENFAK